MLNWADWVVIAVIAISCLISLWRGFVKEALSLAIWIIALIVASVFSTRLAPFLMEYLSEPSLRQMAAFAILFIATLLIGGAVNYLLSTLVKATGLSGTDKLLGMLFGLLRGLVIIMVVVMYLPRWVPVEEDSWWQESVVVPYFLGFEDRFRAISGALLESIKSFF